MKAILVLAGGGETDVAVFGTAYAVAAPLAAHLEFLHVRLDPGDAALFTPHVSFARGPALNEALGRLEAEDRLRSSAARERFQHFCSERQLAVTDAPLPHRAVSAAWREEKGDAVARVLHRARHHDLVVVGRAPRANGLPSYLGELLLLGCGRPVLIAPLQAPRQPPRTVLVCWKETAEAARALTAALPLLAHSEHVVVAGVEEGQASPEDGLDVARQMAWHGISAEARWIAADGRPTATLLESAAAECGADLIVMGGYGHSRARELVFGGCTQRFLDRADRPILLMH